jgi:mRNA interferase MazF
MTSYSFGDVVLVGFPFTNLQASKRRPAVIIHSPAYHDRPDVIVMAITSRVREPLDRRRSPCARLAGRGTGQALRAQAADRHLGEGSDRQETGAAVGEDRERLVGMLDSILGGGSIVHTCLLAFGTGSTLRNRPICFATLDSMKVRGCSVIRIFNSGPGARICKISQEAGICTENGLKFTQ